MGSKKALAENVSAFHSVHNVLENFLEYRTGFDIIIRKG